MLLTFIVSLWYRTHNNGNDKCVDNGYFQGIIHVLLYVLYRCG